MQLEEIIQRSQIVFAQFPSTVTSYTSTTAQGGNLFSIPYKFGISRMLYKQNHTVGILLRLVFLLSIIPLRSIQVVACKEFFKSP